MFLSVLALIISAASMVFVFMRHREKDKYSDDQWTIYDDWEKEGTFECSGIPHRMGDALMYCRQSKNEFLGAPPRGGTLHQRLVGDDSGATMEVL